MSKRGENFNNFPKGSEEYGTGRKDKDRHWAQPGDELLVGESVNEAWEEVRDVLWGGRKRNELGVIFRDEDPETIAWIDDYLERIKTGERHDKNSYEAAMSFVEGAVVPKHIASRINRFVGSDELGEDYTRIKEQPFNLKTVTGELGCSRSKAADVVAFVTLLDEKYTLGRVLELRDQGNFEHLQAMGVTKDEAETVTRVMKDKDHIDYLVKTFFLRSAPVLAENTTSEALLKEFAYKMRIHCPRLRKEMQKFFADPIRQKECREIIVGLAPGSIDEAMSLLPTHEYLFGEIDKNEFLTLFPNWQEAKDYNRYYYVRKYNLRDPDSESEVFGGRRRKKYPSLDLSELEVQPGEGDRAERRVRVVKEDQLLKLREERREETGVSKRLFPYAVKKERPAALVSSRQVDGLRQLENQEVTVFVPLDRNEGQYLEEIEPAVTEIKMAVEMRERVRIFLDKIWPQFLVARADAAPIENIKNQVTEAINLIDSSVGDDFRLLVEYSDDVAFNKGAIEMTAARLRNSNALHEQGVYVQTQVLDRHRNTREGERVSFISTMSYEIDEREEYVINKQRSDILYLGARIDTIDKEVEAMGFRYTGDGHGVVLKEKNRAAANRSIIPYLTDDTEYFVLSGETIHPLHNLVQKAFRRDLGENPDEDQIDKIYKNRYESTKRHELQHADDEAQQRHAHLVGTDLRVAQEISAYLSNIVDEESSDRLVAPFVDLVDVIQVHVSYKQNPFARLEDFFGVYEQATARILLRFAEKLEVNEVNEQSLETDSLGACALVLSRALEGSSARVSELAAEILREVMGKESDQGEDKKEGLAVLGHPTPAPNRPHPKQLAAPNNFLVDEGERYSRTQGRAVETVVRALAVSLIASMAASQLDNEPGPSPEPEGSSQLDNESESESEPEADSELKSLKEIKEIEEQLSGRGLWGYAEHVLNKAGFTFESAGRAAQKKHGGKQPEVIKEKQKRIYSAAIDVLSRYLGGLIKMDGSLGTHPEFGHDEMEQWERRITDARAKDIRELLEDRISEEVIQEVVKDYSQ
jgi:hypothetical protein